MDFLFPLLGALGHVVDQQAVVDGKVGADAVVDEDPAPQQFFFEVLADAVELQDDVSE